MDIYFNLSVFIIVVIATIYFLRITFRYIKLNKISELETNKFLYGVYSRRHLYCLTPNEFEKWCSYLLRRLGYENVVTTIKTGDGGKDIVCEKDNEKIYIECKKYLYKELAEHNIKMSCNENTNHQVVGREILQKLVGSMVVDGVYKGMVITTSSFNTNAIKYVNSLPSEYKVRLIDGKTLCEMYEETILNNLDITREIPSIDIIK